MDQPEQPPLAPVEFLLLGFDGPAFDESVAAAVGELVETGLVHLLDVAMIRKADDGRHEIVEMQELPDDIARALKAIAGDIRGLMSVTDLEEVADTLKPGTGVLALLVEHVWASRFADAVRGAGGRLLVSERIRADLLEAARRRLAEAAGLAAAETRPAPRRHRDKAELGGLGLVVKRGA